MTKLYSAVKLAEVAKDYHELQGYLTDLREIRGDGAVLGWLATRYIGAQTVIERMKQLPKDTRESLELGRLEQELADFGNTHFFKK